MAYPFKGHQAHQGTDGAHASLVVVLFVGTVVVVGRLVQIQVWMMIGIIARRRQGRQFGTLILLLQLHCSLLLLVLQQ